MLLENLESSGGVRRFEHLVAERPEGFDAVLAHRGIILDDQYRLARRGCALGLLDTGCDSSLRRGARQIDLYRRALTELAVELDMTTRLFDKAVHLAEPQTGSPAFRLCREERLEGP